MLTVWQGLRLYEIAHQWSALQKLSPPPPVGYLAISALLWTLAGIALTWGLATSKSWARRGTQIAAPLYAAGYWLDRLLVAVPEAISSRWPFALGLTLAMLVFTFWALSAPRARQHDSF